MTEGLGIMTSPIRFAPSGSGRRRMRKVVMLKPWSLLRPVGVRV